jgi:hypothetical protein
VLLPGGLSAEVPHADAFIVTAHALFEALYALPLQKSDDGIDWRATAYEKVPFVDLATVRQCIEKLVQVNLLSYIDVKTVCFHGMMSFPFSIIFLSFTLAFVVSCSSSTPLGIWRNEK